MRYNVCRTRNTPTAPNRQIQCGALYVELKIQLTLRTTTLDNDRNKQRICRSLKLDESSLLITNCPYNELTLHANQVFLQRDAKV